MLFYIYFFDLPSFELFVLWIIFFLCSSFVHYFFFASSFRSSSSSCWLLLLLLLLLQPLCAVAAAAAVCICYIIFGVCAILIELCVEVPLNRVYGWHSQSIHSKTHRKKEESKHRASYVMANNIVWRRARWRPKEWAMRFMCIGMQYIEVAAGEKMDLVMEKTNATHCICTISTCEEENWKMWTVFCVVLFFSQRRRRRRLLLLLLFFFQLLFVSCRARHGKKRRENRQAKWIEWEKM